MNPAVHWDMICDLRQDGEVYADGELVWKAGRFLHEPVPARGPRRGRRACLIPATSGSREVLVDYSTSVEEGDLVLIESTPARQRRS